MADISCAFSALITEPRPNFIFIKKLCFLGISISVSQVGGRKNRWAKPSFSDQPEYGSKSLNIKKLLSRLPENI